MKRQLKRRQAPRNAVSMVFAAAMMLMTGLGATDARASVTEFTNRTAWEAAVGGPYTTIGFTEYPSFTFLTTEYSHLGVTFDGHLYVGFHGDFDGFPEDGSGVSTTSQHSTTTITFTQPIHAFSYSHGGDHDVRFYNGNTLVHEGVLWGGSGGGFFNGIVSTVAFDSIALSNSFGGVVNIDDIYFAVPAPGALIPLLVAGVLSPRSRRRAA